MERYCVPDSSCPSLYQVTFGLGAPLTEHMRRIWLPSMTERFCSLAVNSGAFSYEYFLVSGGAANMSPAFSAWNRGLSLGSVAEIIKQTFKQNLVLVP